MTLELVGLFVRWIGGLFAYTTLGMVFFGIWRGTQRQEIRTIGFTGGWLRSLWFYLVTVVLFFAICYFGWRPLSWKFQLQTHILTMVLGSLLYFPGMSYVFWGRLALGNNYFVSTSFGVQLFACHELVTSGPFNIVRHPMYSGLILAALGSLLIYSTWTTLLFAFFTPLILVCARREEAALAAEFGGKWQVYCQRVPAFLPRIW